MTAQTEFEIFDCPLDAMVLIEASAGTGKTYNICALYLRLLLEFPYRSVSEILVVTFTTAATAELKNRIRSRIAEVLFFLDTTDTQILEKLEKDAFLQKLDLWIKQTGQDKTQLQEKLRTALASFDEAAIFTIHGFCQTILKSKAFSAGQAFSATVEPNDQEIITEVVNDFWRKHIAYTADSPPLLAYLIQKRVSPQTLKDFLLRSYSKPLAEHRMPDKPVTSEPISFPDVETVFAKMLQCWEKSQAAIRSAILAAAGKDLDGRTYTAGAITQVFSEYERLFQIKDVFALSGKLNMERLLLLSQNHLLLKTRAKGTTPAHVFFELAGEWIRQLVAAHENLEAVYRQLLLLLVDEIDTVRRKKQERRVISYDDMLYNLHSALANGDSGRRLARHISQTYTAALIDEFQDTDPVQFSIFSAIYKDTALPVYLVGDPKQAIYRFRNADLHTYFKAKNQVQEHYSLMHNQRSTPRLINACNTLFMQNRQAFMLNGLDYVKVSAGARTRLPFVDTTVSPEEPADGMILWQLPQGTDHSHLTRSEAKNASTIAVASEIARLLRASGEGKITIAGKPLAGSDILVLVRSHNDGSLIKAMLENFGIASVTFSQESVWKTSDARELSLILYAALHPKNSARINAALTTELLGLDSEKMEQLAHNNEATMEELEKFTQYHDNWLRRGISFMLRQLMSERNVYSEMLKRPDGERRLTNIFHLTELVNAAAETHRTPEALVRWFSQQMDNPDNSEDTQLRLESDDELVRIRTIHGAKGLEAPIVFCPYLWDAWPRQNRNNLPGLSYHDGEKLVFDLNPITDEEKKRIENALRDEQREEDMRLLYVALTRAIYRCHVIVGCYLQSGQRDPTPWHSSRGLLNWLAAGNNTPASDWFDTSARINRLAEIDQAWEELGKKENGITVRPLPDESALHEKMQIPAPDRSEVQLKAAQVTETIPASWRISSFTGLVFGAEYDAIGNDYDESIQDPVPERESLAKPEPDDILHFPAHRYAGNCLHEVFENVDFKDENTWDRAIENALRHHPPRGRTEPGAKDDEALWPLMIKTMLKNVFDTPLLDGLRLAEIDNNKKIIELEFVFPTKNLSAAALNGLLRRHYDIPPLAFPEFGGYIRGFMDLVFEHEGRFYILDWKSNRLGQKKSDYDKTSVEQAMKHGYHLQHLLYSLALDRYLAQCIPDYVYEKHFGGVFYLFVRGVRPDWKMESGEPYGVYFHRANASVIEALFRLVHTGEV